MTPASALQIGSGEQLLMSVMATQEQRRRWERDNGSGFLLPSLRRASCQAAWSLSPGRHFECLLGLGLLPGLAGGRGSTESKGLLVRLTCLAAIDIHKSCLGRPAGGLGVTLRHWVPRGTSRHDPAPTQTFRPAYSPHTHAGCCCRLSPIAPCWVCLPMCTFHINSLVLWSLTSHTKDWKVWHQANFGRVLRSYY